MGNGSIFDDVACLRFDLLYSRYVSLMVLFPIDVLHGHMIGRTALVDLNVKYPYNSRRIESAITELNLDNNRIDGNTHGT